MHLAWVWRMKDAGLQTLLFVDGKRGGPHSAAYRKTEPAFAPTALLLARLNAAYDELRLSDVPRYTSDFTPPARDRELEVDEHTRALLHFNGDLRCVGHAGWQGEGVLE